ncbi:ThiF family adenylyltransferase [Sinobaca sp. H24]|uniref:ThiF family adenylyltransferase n=1 Tax=Sinobaca sp. H24 TaxID=2923376 RepID=UPI00207A7C3F|nr:ThiF family adenylyltransferase [Sinobaca sp. H24]
MNDRYSRQILFPGIGPDGQASLQTKHALILGAGALGSAAAETLVRAGVGELTIIDRDYVEWSNLPRQQLYGEKEAEAKMPKAVAAKERLQAIRSDAVIHSLVMDATAEKLEDIAPGLDILIDGSDNFDIRFILNDLSQKYRIPWVFGACAGSYGMSFTIIPGETPCLQCILPAIPAFSVTCETDGVIAPAVQMTSAYQTAEALKILSGRTEAVQTKLTLFDVWKNQHHAIQVGKTKKDTCPSCGTSPAYAHLAGADDTKMAVLCGRDTVQIRPETSRSYDFTYLETKLSRHGRVQKNPYLLSCALPDYRLVVFRDGRVLVHGTKKVEQAKAIYEKYFLS